MPVKKKYGIVALRATEPGRGLTGLIAVPLGY